MAQLSVFGYRHRPTLIHLVDVRVKLSILVAISITTLHAQWIGLMVASVVAILVLYKIRLPIRQALHELRWFLLLLLVVWMIRCLNTPGDPLVAWYGIELTHQGAVVGAMICWRWLLIVCFGMGLTASTRSVEISAAVEWGLRPLLGKSAHSVGLMIGLLMRSISLILTQTKEIADAQRSRAIENRKNPLYRMKMTALPLMRRSFLSADRMAMAIAARSYSECRTPHQWTFKRGDVIALMITFFLCSVMVLA